MILMQDDFDYLEELEALDAKLNEKREIVLLLARAANQEVSPRCRSSILGVPGSSLTKRRM